MASLDWRIKGINGDQIANEIATPRANSPTFRSLEQMAWNRGYRSVEVTMGSGLHKWSIADSAQSDKDPSVREIRISSDATGTFGIGGRQITTGEIIAHELAHGVVPAEVAQRGTMDFRPNSPEEQWVRRQAGAVADDLFLPGFNNAHFPITRVPVDAEQACTFGNIQGNTPRDGVLFLDGSRGSNGRGSSIPGRWGSIDPGFNPIPNSDPAPVGFGNFAGLGSAIPWCPATGADRESGPRGVEASRAFFLSEHSGMAAGSSEFTYLPEFRQQCGSGSGPYSGGADPAAIRGTPASRCPDPAGVDAPLAVVVSKRARCLRRRAS